MRLPTLKAYTTTLVIFKLLLLLALVGFEVLPLTTGNDDLVIANQMNLQVARGEFLSKDVLILAYRPIQFHSQAVSELQTILPMFHQVQSGLLHGDTTLGLPSNPNDEVAHFILASQADETALETAIKVILAQPEQPPDPIEVSIVLQHEPTYTIAMYQASVVQTQQSERLRTLLLIFRSGIAFFVLLAFLLNYLLVTRNTLKRIEQTEAQTTKQNQTQENKHV